MRPGKKLLVLDIDYTLFDHRSTAETGAELMRPFLHEFLTSAYKVKELCVCVRACVRPVLPYLIILRRESLKVNRMMRDCEDILLVRAWSRNLIKMSLHELFWTSCSLSVLKGHEVVHTTMWLPTIRKRNLVVLFLFFFARCRVGLSAGVISPNLLYRYGYGSASTFLFFSSSYLGRKGRSQGWSAPSCCLIVDTRNRP